MSLFCLSHARCICPAVLLDAVQFDSVQKCMFRGREVFAAGHEDPCVTEIAKTGQLSIIRQRISQCLSFDYAALQVRVLEPFRGERKKLKAEQNVTDLDCLIILKSQAEDVYSRDLIRLTVVFQNQVSKFVSKAIGEKKGYWGHLIGQLHST